MFKRIVSLKACSPFILAGLLALLCGLAPAQTDGTVSGGTSSPSTAKPVDESAPRFHASTRLVLVDVVATDKSGKTVKGLKMNDFTVLQDGKQQPVRVFESHVWKPELKLEKINLPSNQYTNFSEQDPNSAVNAVLLDVLNTPQQDQQYARKQMIEFLRNLPPGQKIALFVLGTKLRMVQGFSGDSDRLVHAAQSILSNTSPLLTTQAQYQDTTSEIAYFADMAGSSHGSVDTSIGPRLLAAFQGEVTAQSDRRARMTLDALSSLAGAVSGYSGRKNLFWLSGTFPFRLGPDFSNDPIRVPDNYAAAIRETAALLLASQIAVYPIDARGAQTTAVSASARSQVTIGSATSQVNAAQSLRYSDYADTKGTMDDIARETGGRAFIGNDLKNMMERGIEQGSTYYTLAFSPTVKKWDGEYHKIEVKTGYTGVKLEYRRGFYAVLEQEAPGDRAGVLLFAAMQPSVPESTMLLIRVLVLMPDKDHNKIRIDYAVAPQDISFTESKDGRKVGTIDFVAAVYNREGKDIGHAVDTMEANIRPEAFSEVLKTGLPFHQELDPKAGGYLLRVGVMDRRTRKIGTVDVPLDTAGPQQAAK